MRSKVLGAVVTTTIGAFVSGGAVAAAEVPSPCTAITTIPTEITVGGRYCLTRSFTLSTTTPAAIKISAPDVTLDLGDWSLSPAPNVLATFGVLVAAPNARVRNGALRRFSTGVQIDSSAAVVENLVIDEATMNGIATNQTMLAHGSMIRNNRIFGRVFLAQNTFVGIQATGSGEVRDNWITVVAAPTTARFAGISVLGPAWRISGNHVVSIPIVPNSVGINTMSGIVADNLVSGFNKGIQINPQSSGIYTNNTVINAVTPFTGGTRGPGNTP